MAPSESRPSRECSEYLERLREIPDTHCCDLEDAEALWLEGELA